MINYTVSRKHKYLDFNSSVELLLLNEIQSPYVYKRLGKCKYNTFFVSMEVYSYIACRAEVPTQLLNVNNEHILDFFPIFLLIFNEFLIKGMAGLNILNQHFVISVLCYLVNENNLFNAI